MKRLTEACARLQDEGVLIGSSLLREVPNMI